MATDQFSISALRTKARALRTQADEIDALADSVQRVMDNLVVPANLFTAVKQPMRHPRTTEAARSSKGKAPGTMNMSWRANFARIADVTGRDEFPLDLVRDIVQESTGRDVKLSGLRRQFKDYIKHDYVTSDAPDRYRLTDKLLMLVDYQGNGDSSRNENGAPEGAPDDGDVAAPPFQHRLHQLVDAIGDPSP